MKVREIMAAPAVTVPEDATLEAAAQLMLRHRIGCLPVVNAAGKLSGILTESDFSARECGVPFSTLRLPQLFRHWMPHDAVERLYRAARETKVAELMTRDVAAVRETDSVESAIRQMLEHRVHRLPVLRDGVPVGIVARHDLLRLMVDSTGKA